MKKKYKKPIVMFEEIAFNTAIADACGFYAINWVNNSESICEPIFKSDKVPVTYVADEISGCTSEFYCYHNPDGGKPVTLVNQS